MELKECALYPGELLVSGLKKFKCNFTYFNSRENNNYVIVQMDLTVSRCSSGFLSAVTFIVLHTGSLSGHVILLFCDG